MAISFAVPPLSLLFFFSFLIGAILSEAISIAVRNTANQGRYDLSTGLVSQDEKNNVIAFFEKVSIILSLNDLPLWYYHLIVRSPSTPTDVQKQQTI